MNIMSNGYDKFQDMFSEVLSLDVHKYDFRAACREMVVTDDGNLVIQGEPYELEYTAFSHLVKQIVDVTTPSGVRASKTSVVDYLWKNRHNGIFQYAMEKHIDEHPDKEFLVRAYKNSVRAFVSPNYAVLNNSAVMMNVMSVLGKNNFITDDFHVAESVVERDEIRIKIVIEEHREGHYGTGLYFTNNELGAGSVTFHSLVKRHSCDNSLVAAENRSLYHRGDIDSRFSLVEPDLVNSIRHSSTLLQMIEESRHKTLTAIQMDMMISKLKERYSLSEAFVERIYEGSEGQMNLWGIVSGITWASKTMRDREQYEAIAGKLLIDKLKK